MLNRSDRFDGKKTLVSIGWFMVIQVGLIASGACGP